MKTINVAEFSAMVGKSSRHIRELCKEGKLPCWKEEIPTGTRYLIYVGTKEYNKYLSMAGQEVFETREGSSEGGLEGSKEVSPEIDEEVIEGSLVVKNNQALDLIKEINKIHEKYQTENLKLYKELLNEQQKTLLLEDSEARKEAGYLKLISELKAENERLKNYKILGIRVHKKS